jgi:formate hydrogenlyase subunit 6/NADH:ubiquinone oxidoreductase subunit I
VASFDLRWIHAQFFLGWKLVRHWLLKVWPWAEHFGFVRFQENYVPEGLPPSTPSFRLLAHEPGRCTACNQCDQVCPILHGDLACDDPQFLGPMTFILSATRQAPELHDVAATLRVLNGAPCNTCRKCDAACPEHIPIAKLAEVYEQQRAIIEGARAGKLPITDAKRALPPWVGRAGR